MDDRVTPTPSIRAVLVLFHMQLQDSPTFRSLARLLQQGEAAALALRLSVFDNTPGAARVTPLDGIEYEHNPSNPGLAKSYNRALARATEQNDEWLMLLDQDTVLTATYLQETLDLVQRFADDAGPVALVPKLVEADLVHSPHYDLAGLMQERVSRDFQGFSSSRLHAFNSGAVIRAAALRAIGGFPEKFWLDFLDHATFHALQAGGGRVYVMSAELQHQLSTNAAIRGWDRTYLARHANLLAAESDFYRMYGDAHQKRWYRLRLARHAVGSMMRFRLPLVWQLLRALVKSV